jgi:MFS family permease
LNGDVLSLATLTPGQHLADEKIKVEGEYTTQTPQSPEDGTVTGFRFIAVLFAVYSTATLYGLDTTIVADIQGAVVETFGQVEKLSWIGTAFPLGSISLVLMVGKAYGVFNMKWLYIFSVTLFEAGSALCGGAPNMNVSPSVFKLKS